MEKDALEGEESCAQVLGLMQTIYRQVRVTLYSCWSVRLVHAGLTLIALSLLPDSTPSSTYGPDLILPL